jgi:hypothetical protein
MSSSPNTAKKKKLYDIAKAVVKQKFRAINTYNENFVTLKKKSKKTLKDGNTLHVHRLAKSIM